MRRINKNFFSVTILSIFLVSGSIAQSPSDRQNYLPKVIGSSPDTKMMERFGNYSVNLYNGLPQISIPLYEINTGKLKVPVTLSYHAGGVRVRDESGWVGLGWNLSAGGAISRTVKSKADEILGWLNGSHVVRTPSSLDALNVPADLNYSNDVARGIYDVEPDIYSMNLPTLNNKFYYANRSISQPVMIPFNPLKLTSTLTGNNLSFNVKDESGIEYILGNDKETFSSGTSLDFYATAWNLSQMISDDRTDTIYFSYVSNGYNGGGGDYYDITTVTDYVTNAPTSNSCGGLGICNTCQGLITATSGGGQSHGFGSNALQEIRFPEGKVVFELDVSNRQDLANKSLKSVKIYKIDPVSKAYLLLKSYIFYYSYFVNGTEKRLRLDSLQLKDRENVNIQSYNFTYNNSIPLRNTRDKDWWGYFNNRGNNSLLPRMTIDIWGPNGGVTTSQATIGSNIVNGKEPDPLYNQQGVLTKITYPTGGNSEFTYETNQYYDNNTSTVKYGGGLRIKQIKNTDPVTSNINYKTYKYGYQENGYGDIIIPVNLSYFSTEQYYYYAYNELLTTRRIRTFASNPNIGFDPCDGSSVGYQYVTEYNGTESVNSGKSVYGYSFVADNYNYQLVQYSRPAIVSRYFERGQLTSKTDYRKHTDGSFKQVRNVSNSYGVWPNVYSPTGNLRLFEKTTYQQQHITSASICTSTTSNSNQPYAYGTDEIVTGDNRLKTTIETVFNALDESKYVVTTTNYSYENFTHMQVTKTSVVNSRSETSETVFKYPHDVTATATITGMKASNMINKVIDQETKLNTVKMTSVHNEYGTFGTNHYYPSYITTATRLNTPETEVTFNTYDAQGNITRFTGKDGSIANFIWDYGINYPVAKVVNAAATDIAYTSFEADGKGYWTFTGIPLLDPTCPTGKRCYTLTSNISKSGLSTSTTYIVSYWKKSGTVSVNGTAAVAGRSVNGWTYYEHKVVNPVSGIITITGGTGIIDELRLYPAGNVQMTTYTYEPLVGMTSQCDPNNRIIYYEYDALQRLMLVRDQDYNILKKVCYNYAGQPEACNVFYNQQVSSEFTKACTGNFIGSKVSYFVPANTYSASTLAAANQLAWDDVYANGQAYANATGTCTAGVAITGYNNKSGTNYSVKFTSGSYTFTFPLPNGATVQTLGYVLPNLTYSVQFFPSGSSGTGSRTYVAGPYSTNTTATTWTANSVSVGTTSIMAYMY